MPLRAGAARIDITPRLGCHLDGNLTDRVSTNIHDPLYASALVLENDGTRLGIALSDIIIVTREMADEVKQRVFDAVGILPENLLVTATHTHYGPAVYGALATVRETDYVAWAPARIADAVIQAAQQTEPAQLAWTAAEVPSEIHVRRYLMKDGTLHTNPGCNNPDVLRPATEADPTLSLLVVRRIDRSPLAVMGNLGLHYVGSKDSDVSADYFGYFRNALQRCAGAEFVCFMTNGCFGDVNNVNVFRPHGAAPHPYYRCERVANVCAGAAWQAWNTLWEEDFTDEPALAAALEHVEMIPRRPTPKQIAEGRAYLAAHTIEEDAWRWCYAQEHVLMEDWPERYDLPLQALRIGATGVVGLPGEVFTEIGRGIRAQSPFKQTVTVGLANDTVGYVAPDHELDRGGYETTLCRHVTAPKGTAQCWTETATRLLQRVQGS